MPAAPRAALAQLSPVEALIDAGAAVDHTGGPNGGARSCVLHSHLKNVATAAALVACGVLGHQHEGHFDATECLQRCQPT